MSRRDPREEALRAALLRERPEDEDGALERALQIGAAEHRALLPSRRRRSSRRLIPALLGTAALAAFALTPAGAQVRDWVGDAVTGDDAEVRGTLDHVPSGGSLLIASGAERYAVADDGSTRLLGSYDSAAWSPNAAYVAAAHGDELAAIDPDGDLRWRIYGPGPIADQAWAPGCCRVAYRSGGGLWVVDGDGTDDHELVPRIAPIAPAWMPVPYDSETQDSPNVIAFLDSRGRLVTVDADSEATSTPIGAVPDPRSLFWLDRSRILVAGSRSLAVVNLRAGSVRNLDIEIPGKVARAAVAPDSGAVAILAESQGAEAAPRVESTLLLASLNPGAETVRTRVLFSGLGRFDGPVYSPDGTRIELGWREADQWRFISPDPGVEPVAVGGITRQFDPGGGGGPAPRIEDWCCP
jgi:hypothetical protein